MTFKVFMGEVARQLVKWLSNLVHVVSLGIVRVWKLPAVQRALESWGTKALEIGKDFVDKKLQEVKDKVEGEKK